MKFENYIFSYLLLIIPIVILVVYINSLRRKKYLAAFAEKRNLIRLIPSFSFTRRFWKTVLVILSLVFLILAIMRPQYGVKFVSLMRKGQSVLFAIDTSSSMLAGDVLPSRFEKAKSEMFALLENLEGDDVGTIAFAGESLLVSPFTRDYDAVKMFLADVQVGMLSRPGSNFGALIQKARLIFNNKRTNRVLIIFSDGEFFDKDIEKSIALAKRYKVTIYTVGIGKSVGEPIPEKDKTGQTRGYKKDKDEQIVLTKLDEKRLKKIARDTGGKYYFGGNTSLVVEKIYKELSGKDTEDIEKQKQKMFIDRYQYVLIFVFVFLMMDVFVSERKR
jgi:Ca-activated chloride channel homolog